MAELAYKKPESSLWLVLLVRLDEGTLKPETEQYDILLETLSEK